MAKNLTYSQLIEQYALVIERIYDDCKRETAISNLSNYVNEYENVTITYLRKLPSVGILKQEGNSKRYTRYKWNAGEIKDKMDFKLLADKILSAPGIGYTEQIEEEDVTPKEEPKEIKQERPTYYILPSDKIGELTLLLADSGVKRELIPKLVNDIVSLIHRVN